MAAFQADVRYVLLRVGCGFYIVAAALDAWPRPCLFG
jgi:hypothetical protein